MIAFNASYLSWTIAMCLDLRSQMWHIWDEMAELGRTFWELVGTLSSRTRQSQAGHALLGLHSLLHVVILWCSAYLMSSLESGRWSWIRVERGASLDFGFHRHLSYSNMTVVEVWLSKINRSHSFWKGNISTSFLVWKMCLFKPNKQTHRGDDHFQ